MESKYPAATDLKKINKLIADAQAHNDELNRKVLCAKAVSLCELATVVAKAELENVMDRSTSSSEYLTEEDSSEDDYGSDPDTKYDAKGRRRIPLLSERESAAPTRAMPQRFEDNLRKLPILQKSINSAKRNLGMPADDDNDEDGRARKKVKTASSPRLAQKPAINRPAWLKMRMDEAMDAGNIILEQFAAFVKAITAESMNTRKRSIQEALTHVAHHFGAELLPNGLELIRAEFERTEMGTMYLIYPLDAKRAYLETRGVLMDPRELRERAIEKAIADVKLNFGQKLVSDGLQVILAGFRKTKWDEIYLILPMEAKRAYLEREGVLAGLPVVQKPLNQYAKPSSEEKKGRVREWLAAMDTTCHGAKSQRTA
ncbi:hypothetical protein BDP55DRAFT_664779 [Colletotrichum godetiae]|uniref:Uncharacterized protein n=1 Tax=Colletotrichum godetiae TaxID=1209918 RepID=A0AAJ0AMM3_9PEZI|nr:uncharacterized protein BDP55DRAFT_664779 [Colletotrichum godetiae]KAK1675167.1 hypothetical protein BDP55DRAFT_664779 [Colletotrichum godetiae]